MRDKWVEKRICDLANSLPKSFVDGDWIESPYITNKGIRLIQTGNIGVGFFKNKSKKFISEKSFRMLNCTEVFPGDVLICRLAEPAGRACIVPDLGERYITSVDVSILRLSNKYSKEYIHQLLNTDTILNKVEILSGGSTRQRISRINLGNIILTLPPLPQQRKIAKILSTCDTVIEKTEAAIAKYQAIKQGMMHDLFTRGIDLETGKLRPKYEEAPELYKESELGMIPKEWEDSIFKNYTIKNLYGPRFSANDYNSEGNVKTIRGMDFSKDGDILYHQAPIASLPYAKVQAHLLENQDIIIVTTADCGLTAVFEKQNFQFIPSAYSVKFKFNEKVKPYFMKFFMQTDCAKRMVNKYVRQGTLGNLPGSDILEFKIGLPQVNEQKVIINRLKSVEVKLQTEQTTLSKYRQIKSGLMQDLLSGEVEVQVGEGEK
jgi:type I restriction enzyme, S subunit